MATKSFTTEFKMNAKAGYKLANAIDRSRKVEHQIHQRTSDVVRKEEINKIMEDFLGER